MSVGNVSQNFPAAGWIWRLENTSRFGVSPVALTLEDKSVDYVSLSLRPSRKATSLGNPGMKKANSYELALP